MIMIWEHKQRIKGVRATHHRSKMGKIRDYSVPPCHKLLLFLHKEKILKDQRFKKNLLDVNVSDFAFCNCYC